MGFSSFDDLKNSMKSNATKGMSKILQLEQDVVCVKQMFVEIKQQYEQSVTAEWELYKQCYMKYINDEDNGNA